MWISYFGFHNVDNYSPDEDLILRLVIVPIVTSFRQSGKMRRFFFVRYSEAGKHLRCRFLMNPDCADELCKELQRMAAATGRRVNWQPGVYEPEHHRYGGVEEIEAAEWFFDASSSCALEAIVATGHGRDRHGIAFVMSYIFQSAVARARMGIDSGRIPVWPALGSRNDGFVALEDGRDVKTAGATIRYLQSSGIQDELLQKWSGLCAALADSVYRRLEKVIADNVCLSQLHMHYNRLGIDRENEARLIALVSTANRVAMEAE